MSSEKPHLSFLEFVHLGLVEARTGEDFLSHAGFSQLDW